MGQTVKTLLTLTLGALIQGIGMGLFLFPHHIPSGGAAGIAVINEFFWNIPHGWSLWLVNVPLLFAAVKFLGAGSAGKTVFAVTVTSITVDVIGLVLSAPISVPWIDLLFGACLFGIGVGILFKNGASSGGMAILAQIFAKMFNRPPGQVMFWINGVIFLITAFVVGWWIFLFAICTQWIGTKVLDIVYKEQLTIVKLRKALHI
ncbi:YitT family protein [Pseudalkalibacillus berkeleyi]|uniref:YitT family protein n=1 Tax=Pseudalkalibacillus berkeleyi TaxID=1069813 RepID=A0ABS9H678_9BACL|nr:YitT family protein [Pseudalkalibacillus berkeleyi]MCF6139295.1 YitT family protein [Pseudalkalibacillus berkeleyi]